MKKSDKENKKAIEYVGGNLVCVLSCDVKTDLEDVTKTIVAILEKAKDLKDE